MSHTFHARRVLQTTAGAWGLSPPRDPRLGHPGDIGPDTCWGRTATGSSKPGMPMVSFGASTGRGADTLRQLLRPRP